MFRTVLSPNRYDHEDNNKLTCPSTGRAIVIVKEICAKEQATSAYARLSKTKTMEELAAQTPCLGESSLDIRTG